MATKIGVNMGTKLGAKIGNKMVSKMGAHTSSQNWIKIKCPKMLKQRKKIGAKIKTKQGAKREEKRKTNLDPKWDPIQMGSIMKAKIFEKNGRQNRSQQGSQKISKNGT